MARLMTHAEIGSTLRAPEAHSKIEELAMRAIANTPERFAARINSGIEQYGRLIKSAGIKPQ